MWIAIAFGAGAIIGAGIAWAIAWNVIDDMESEIATIQAGDLLA